MADLMEERQLGKALRKNQEKFQQKISEMEAKYNEKEKEIVDLKEQLRDLMFFIDAKQVFDLLKFLCDLFKCIIVFV